MHTVVRLLRIIAYFRNPEFIASHQMLEAIHAHASQQDLKARKSYEEAEQVLSDFLEKSHREMETAVTEVYAQNAQKVIEKQKAVAALQEELEQVCETYCACMCLCVCTCTYVCVYIHTYIHKL
jgi:hypothetical protein